MNLPSKCIATDATHSIKEKLTRYRVINLLSGEELFSEAVGNQTANIGAFLGIVAAIRYILENKVAPATIYSDNTIAINWFNNQVTAPLCHCPSLHKAEIFLKAIQSQTGAIEIQFWNKNK